MDIRFLNASHEILRIENKFISSNWQIKFNDYGDYLGEFGKNEKLFKLLRDNDFVYLEQDGKQAIITGLEFQDNLKVYGRSLNYILEKMKPIIPKVWTNINIETIAREIATEAFSYVADFELGTLKGIAELTTFEVEDIETPLESLKRLLGNTYGFNVYVENKKWKFELLTSQTKNLVLSESMKNATEIIYTENVDEYASNALIFNETTQIYDDIVGEVKTGIKKWYGEEPQKKEKLIELETRKIKYNKDYVLGDILRVKKDNDEYSKIITEVIFWYETNNIGEKPILSEVN